MGRVVSLCCGKKQVAFEFGNVHTTVTAVTHIRKYDDLEKAVKLCRKYKGKQI